MKMTGMRRWCCLAGFVCGWCAVASAAGAEEVNLAAGRRCKTFSSHEADGWSARQLTDGQTGGLGWSSKAFLQQADHRLYPEYVIVDLGRNCLLRAVTLSPRGDSPAAGKGFPEDFTIQACREGEDWKLLVTQRGYAEPKDGSGLRFDFNATPGRYVKVEATRLRDASDGTHRFQLAELEVRGQEQAGEPLSAPVAPPAAGPTILTRLRCENRDDPMGIDAAQPRFSWWMQSSVRGQRQTAYRILVSADESTLAADRGDIWDSGKVTSDATVAIEYAGQPLESARSYCWKVMAWDHRDEPTAWSAPAKFVTGKLATSDWKGDWIGADGESQHAAVYLRKEFTVPRPVKRAMVFWCGLGYSELSIDGRKVGADTLVPGPTCYDQRVQYLTYDVTDRLSPGRCVLGVTLADGWYGLVADPWVHKFETNVYVDRPKLRLDLHVEYADGSTETIVSDTSWKWSSGPIVRSWICEEDVDNRQVHAGWDRSDFNDSAWRPVTVAKAPAGRLVSQRERPTRSVEEIRPANLRHDEPADAWVYDLGREVDGRVRFRTSGPAGTVVTITTLPSAPHPRTSRFVLAGATEDEEYQQRFSHSAIRQVAIKGLTRPPKLEDLTVSVVSSVTAPTGQFRCSDDLANWLNATVIRTVVNYTTWLPNDPVREWKAWTQDEESMFWSSAYLYDCQTMYARWQDDFIDGQRPDGNLPNVTPGAFFDDYNSPWWGGCAVWLPWEWYQYYGDSALLRASYPAMRRYVDYLSAVAKDGLQDWGLLDWLPVEETPRPIINTPAHYLFAQIVSRTAELLGKSDEARRYARLAETIRADYNRHFLDAKSGIYGQVGWRCRQGNSEAPVDHEVWWPDDRPCTQAGQVLPLALGMVPDDVRSVAEQALLREIAAHRGHLSTGFVSTPYMLALLADLAPEVGWTMTAAQDYPSWYSMTAGTDHDLLKETWNGGMALMPSLGGNISAWYYQSLGGIRPDPAGPGFKRIIIRPNVVGDLHWVECRHESVRGLIVCHWRRRGPQLVMEVTVPANTTATVYVPASDAQHVRESGGPAAKATGVRYLRTERSAAVFAVESGRYVFESTLAARG